MTKDYRRIAVCDNLHATDLDIELNTRNTSAQVKEFALDNLAKKFEWLKEQLPEFEPVIVYRENERKPVKVRDVIALLTLFNVTLFPNNGSQYPNQATHPKRNHSRGSMRNRTPTAPCARFFGTF
jgi:hypothetical protein